MRRFVVASALLCLAFGALGQPAGQPVGQQVGQQVDDPARFGELYRSLLQRQLPELETEDHECAFKGGSCNTTISGEVNIYGCRSDDGHYFNFHRVFLAANTRVTAALKGNSFTPLIAIFDDNATTTLASNAGTYNGTATVTVTIPASGYYIFGLGPVETARTGTYTLQITCTTVSTGNCTPSDTVMCLNENRFAVSVTWKDFSNKTGAGRAVKLTADSGYFWFFGANNVELMMKVLGPVNGTNYWVFFGALSNVEYTVTVRDTQTNRTKTYFNPSGTLASVADTGAF